MATESHNIWVPHNINFMRKKSVTPIAQMGTEAQRGKTASNKPHASL